MVQGVAMKRLALPLTILLILFTPALLTSQVRGQARMLGIVLDEETGQPIEGVTVKAYFKDTDTSITPSPVTGKDGRWKALYIRGGMWSLEFQKPGYVPQKISHRVVPPSDLFEIGAKVPELEVRLKKIQGVVVRSDALKDLEKGDALYNEKKYQEAVAAYETILEKNPDLQFIKKNIGDCYFAMQNYEKAVECYLQVNEKQPDRGDIFIAIANAYNNWGKPDQAIEWYKKVPVSGIRDINSAFNTGVVFANSGNQADALKYFQKAVEIDPQFADGYYQLGLCQVALGANAEAVAALNKFIELAPDSPDAPTAKAIIDTLAKK
jgi:Tfp pilus assembly protein PilF/5-hydroxyisourate hydrolase-like protein (transthyretin family)